MKTPYGRRLAAALALVALAGCGGGGGRAGCFLCFYALDGTVSGLSGSGLQLRDGSYGTVTIAANGTFSFGGGYYPGEAYDVTVVTQPTNLSQTCVVSNAMGTIGNVDVSNVTVSCNTNTYTVGGTVTGLTGSGLVLRDNDGDNLSVSTNGSFTFATPVASGAAYRVTEFVLPANPAQNCSVKNGTGSGTVTNANVSTVGVACANVGRFAYAANAGDGTISAYTIDAATGALRQIAGSPLATRYNTYSLAANPSGTFLYAIDSGISAYSIDRTTGALSAVAGSPFASNGYSIVVHPNGKFAYTADVNSFAVSAFAIDATTGALTPVPGSPFAAGYNPISVAVDPRGKFLYVANSNATADSVGAYAIDSTSGALSTVPGSPFAAGSGPVWVAVDPSGKFVYVANAGSNDVSAYTIDANTGALTGVAGGPFAAGLNPTAVTVDPSGTFLFVANSGGANPGATNVSAYTIDANTGALTAVAGSPFGTATLPDSVAVDPSGKFVYVANGDPPANSISAYVIDANTGALTPISGSPFAAGANPRFITVTK